MISRFFWNYLYGRARYLIPLGALSAIVFFTNMWFFPTPFLHINGVDQAELSAKPGDEIPVRVARFDSANGLWLTGGIFAVFPTDSGAGIETELVKKGGSEWTWDNFIQGFDKENVTVDGTLVIPRNLPSDGRTIRVDVIGVVNYSTIKTWTLEAKIADSILVTLTDRAHSSATFGIVEQSIRVASLGLAFVAGSLGILFLLRGDDAPGFDWNTNRTLAYMRRAPGLLRNLRLLFDSKARRIPEGYWKPKAVELDFAEFNALDERVTRERTKLQEGLNATAFQFGLKHIRNMKSDQADKELEALDENFTRAYRDLTMMLKDRRRWYQFWYWA